jgi:hypothetical protein
MPGKSWSLVKSKLGNYMLSATSLGVSDRYYKRETINTHEKTATKRSIFILDENGRFYWFSSITKNRSFSAPKSLYEINHIHLLYIVCSS